MELQILDHHRLAALILRICGQPCPIHFQYFFPVNVHIRLLTALMPSPPLVPFCSEEWSNCGARPVLFPLIFGLPCSPFKWLFSSRKR